MPNPPPVPQPLLNQFQSLISSPEVRECEILALISDLQTEQLTEEALFLFRQTRRGPQFPVLRRALEAAANASRVKRATRWHLDGARVHLVIRYARLVALTELNPSETLALLRQTLADAGFPLALGLGKNARAMVTLGHPLPIGCTGLEEWAEAVLQHRPPGDPGAWLEALNKAACEGLLFGAVKTVPSYATSVLDLSREAHWAWPCPPDLREEAEARVASFLAATSFELEKSGKAAGAKIVKQVEVRPLVKGLSWEASTLLLELHVSERDALNPRKLIGGILGVPPDRIEGLTRLRVLLAEDPRLKQAEKFEPKLKNIFEDAVLLGEGCNLLLVDEDEEDPLVLG